MRASVASLTKKFISTFFAATLVLGLIPGAAFAVEDSGVSAPNDEEFATVDIPDTSSDEITQDVISSEDEKSALIEQNEGEALTSSSEEAETVGNAMGGDDSIVIPAAIERINEDVMLATPVAQQETTRTYFLAQTLESTCTVPIVSAQLPLDKGIVDVEVVEPDIEGEDSASESGGDEDSDESDLPTSNIIAADSTVIGSFTYRGITYAVEPGGETVAIVAADYDKLPEDFIEAKAIVLPSMVTADGVDYYSVTRIADYAFSSLNSNEAGIDAITVPATVTAIGDNAFTDFNTLQYIIVSEDNETYSQYDGVLYNADQSRLLLIPEGRLGAVRVAPSVTEVSPEAFSHCPSVDTLVADPASAAYQLLSGMDDIDKELKAELEKSTDAFIFVNLGSIETIEDIRLPSPFFGDGADDFLLVMNDSVEVVDLLLRDGVSFAMALVKGSFEDAPMGILESRAMSNGAETDSSKWPTWIKSIVDNLVANDAKTGDKPTMTLYSASGYSSTKDDSYAAVDGAVYGYAAIGFGRTSMSYNSVKGKAIGDSVTCFTYSKQGTYPGWTSSALFSSLKFNNIYGFFFLPSGGTAADGWWRSIVRTPYSGAGMGAVAKCDYVLKIVYKNATSPFGELAARKSFYAMLPLDFGVNWNVNASGVTISQSEWFVSAGDNKKLSDAEEYSASSGLPVPTRAEYVFTGWYRDAACTDGPIDANEAINFERTFYAGWKPAPAKCTVYWREGDAPSPSSSSNMPSNWYVFEGCELSTSEDYSDGLPSPTKWDSDFGGWYTDYDCTAGHEVTANTMITGDVTFYAKWTLHKSKLTVNPNGGKLNNSTGNATYNMTMRSFNFVQIGAFSRTGWTFNGLYSASSGGTQYYYASGDQAFGVRGSSWWGETNSGVGWRCWNDATAYAQWTANSYTIAYNGNGAGGSTASTSATYDQDVTFRANGFTVPTGKRFLNWNTKSDGKGTSYSASTKYTTPNLATSGTVTLYAIWTNNAYTVRYNGNGGKVSGTNATTATSSHECNVAKNLSANPFNVPPTGKRFKNWNTQADGKGTTYTETQSVTNLSTTNGATVDLYAIWQNNTYTVRYNGNGGKVSGTNATTATSSHECNVAKNLSVNPFNVPPTGKHFLKWNTAVNGTGTSYTETQSVTNLTTTNGATIDLHAIWEWNTYTVTYNPNTGSGSAYTSNHTYNTAQNLTNNKFTAPKGQHFTGWNTQADGKGTSYTETQSVNNLTTANKGNVNLYAQWDNNVYKVTFDANGGTGGITGPIDVTYSKAMPGLGSNWMPSNGGYEFNGWWDTDAKTGGNQYYTPSGTSAKAWDKTDGATLYARWSRLPFHAITLNDARLGDGKDDKSIWYWPSHGFTPSNPNEFPTDGTRDHEIKIVKASDANPNIVAPPTYVDYEFIGYYDEPDGEGGTQKIDAKGNLLTDEEITKATVWYAHWKRLGSTVELKANYGDMVAADIVQGTDKIEHVAFGKDFATPLGENATRIEKIAQVPTRVGYAFMGYFTEPNPEHETEVELADYAGKMWIDADGNLVNEKWLSEEDWKKAPTNLVDKGAIVLYAAWQLGDCIVEFDTDTDANTEPVVHEEGALQDRIWHYNKNMSDTLPTPANDAFLRNGYIFGGWYLLEEDGTEVRVSDAEGAPESILLPWTRDVEEVTLYAYWTPRNYTLQFDPNFPNVEGVARIYEGDAEVKLAYDDDLALVDPDFGAYDFAGWYVYAGTNDEQTVLYGDSLEDVHMTDGRFTPRGDLVKQFDPATIRIVAKWTEPTKRYIHLYAGLPEQGVDESTRVYEPQFYKFATAYAFPEDWLPERVNGWSCKGWVEVEDEDEALEYLKFGYVGDEKDPGISGIDAKVTRVDYHDIYLVAKWTICPLSVTLTTIENEDGTYVKGTDEMVNADSWMAVPKADSLYVKAYDVRQPSFTLPNLSRRGYDFQGWRLQGTEDKPVKSLQVDPFEQAKVEADHDRTYEPVFEVIEYTIILDPNAANLKREEYKVRFTDDFTFPYPVAYNTGAVFSSWATKRAQPLEDDGTYLEFYHAKTYPMSPGVDEKGDPTFCLTDLTTDAERTITLYAKYNGSYKVEVPLVANMAIDTETGDVIPGRTRLETTKDDAVYTVESMRYEPVTDENGYVPFQGANEVYFSVYPGLTFENAEDSYYFLQKAKVGDKGAVTYAAKGKSDPVTATPLLVKLGSKGTPKLFTKTSISDDPNEVTLDSMTTEGSGFRTFSKDNPLDVYYGIHFGDENSWKSTLRRYAFGKNNGGWELPENDAGNTTIYDYPTDDYRRGLGWSTNRVDIAKVRYTLSVQTK